MCHQYTSGWINAWTIPDPPVYGLFAFLQEVQPFFRVSIFSSRSVYANGREAMEQWFRIQAEEYFKNVAMGKNIAQLLCADLEFPAHKPSATVTLDDRAITFTGTWPSVTLLRAFKPWNDHLKQREGTRTVGRNITPE